MPPPQTNPNINTNPKVGGIGYTTDPNGGPATPIQSTVIPGSFDLGPSFTPSKTPVVTSAPVRKEFTGLGNDLSNIKFQGTKAPVKPSIDYSNVNDPYTRALDNLGAKSDASTKALISSIQAQRAMRGNEINSLSDNYARGLQLLGIQRNEAQSTPELLLGRIKSAENQRLLKIQQLDVEENKAILDAERAQAENDVRTLKEKMDYIRQLKKDKQDEIKAIGEEARAHLDQVNKEVDLMKGYATNIMSRISGLQGDAKEAAIQSIADQFNVSVEAVILAASGYTQAKADKAASGGGGGYTKQELRKLRQAGIDSSDVEAADDFLYADKPTEKEFYSLADQYVNDEENLDDEGYLTKDALNALVDQGVSQGFSKSDIVETYKDYVYLNKYKYAKNYGFTKKEWEKYSQF